jgi:hypothetical protein
MFYQISSHWGQPCREKDGFGKMQNFW